jgi:DsbC/DsbD-like thiol-disulfide interchange protein
MPVMKRWIVAALALCAAVVSAQELPPKGGSSGSPIETKHLTVTTSASPETVTAGKPVTLAVDVAPKPKMHVYSPGQDGYIAITLTLDANPAFTSAKAKYPAGEKIYMPILKETQIVYGKPFRILQNVTLRPGTGPLTIKGTLRYQACDDTICYLPATIPVEWTVKPVSGK